MAAWSKAQVCGRSPAEIVGSNPTRGMDVCCECCVLSGRGLCDELITRPEESYLLWCVVVCDLETSRMRRPWPALGRSTTGKKKTQTGTDLIPPVSFSLLFFPTPHSTLKFSVLEFMQFLNTMFRKIYILCLKQSNSIKKQLWLNKLTVHWRLLLTPESSHQPRQKYRCNNGRPPNRAEGQYQDYTQATKQQTLEPNGKSATQC